MGYQYRLSIVSWRCSVLVPEIRVGDDHVLDRLPDREADRLARSDRNRRPWGRTAIGVKTFARRQLRKRPVETIQQGTVYEAYTNWAGERDLDPATKRWFTRKAHNVHDFEAKQARTDIGIAEVYVGITLANAGEAFLDTEDAEHCDTN